MSSITLGTVEVVAKHLVDCLRHLKSKGVVHRDLKTDNILYMVDARERVNSIKIIDFGVGLGVGPGATEDIFAGKVVGTFSYMAPEQARGKSCFESDLYSTGAILCVMLTGKLPLVFPKTRTRKELAEQIRRIEKAPRPVLTKLNPWLKKHTAMENIAAIVQTMLELNAERRPSLDEVEAALDGEFSHLGDDKYSLSVFYQDS
jgi:serine/threonine-protein kinase